MAARPSRARTLDLPTRKKTSTIRSSRSDADFQSIYFGVDSWNRALQNYVNGLRAEPVLAPAVSLKKSG